MQDQGLYWEKCQGMCGDRAASIIGCHSGATKK